MSLRHVRFNLPKVGLNWLLETIKKFIKFQNSSFLCFSSFQCSIHKIRSIKLSFFVLCGKNTKKYQSVKNLLKNQTISEILQKVLGKMFKWKNKSFPIFLMSQYQFQYQLPGQLVSTRIWIGPVNKVTLTATKYLYLGCSLIRSFITLETLETSLQIIAGLGESPNEMR